MKIEIFGKNIQVTDAIRNAIEDDLSVLDKYFANKELEAHVVVKTYNVGQKVEISIRMDKDHILRQEETKDDLYEAIRVASHKMERQVRKFKSRIVDHKQKKHIMEMFLDQEPKEDNTQITKRKKFDNKLMTEDEALLQFELVGHDFYVFEDANSQISKVLYKRHNGEYGIIEVD